MKKYYQSEGYQYVMKQVIAQSSKQKATILFEEANQACDALLKTNKAESSLEQMHLNEVAKRVALYKVLKREYPNEVWAWMDECARLDGLRMRQFIDRISSNPILRKIFMPMMELMTKNVFGKPAGFKQTITQSTNESISFDIFECPYQKWCLKFGEPELTKNFCDADHHTYDHLSHFAFSRSQTLGYGGTKCDFKYWLK